MKKYVKLLLVLLVVITMVGCKKEEPKKKDNTTTTTKEVLADDEVIVKGIKYKLDQEDTVHGIKVKVASNFRKVDQVAAMSFFSEKIDGSSYFVIRIFKYTNKDIEYAIKDITGEDKEYTREQKTLDGKEYTYLHFFDFYGQDVDVYYYKVGKNIYAITFNSKEDVSRLEEIFLKNIDYGK